MHEVRARLRRFAASVFVAACLAYPLAAHAQVPLVDGLGGTVGFGSACLSPNDDGSSDPVDLSSAFPTGLRFFSGTYDRVVVNTNGNITFNGALPVYTPNAFPVANQPMIAPYWADVDIRPLVEGCGGFGAATGSPGNAPCMNPGSNGVWWHLEPGRFVVTWDRVGYFSCHGDHLMSFQLILTDTSSCASPGDFDVEFRFNRCEWTTGDASGGSGGFGGTPAQAGFDAGDGVHFFSVPGSLMPDIHTRMCTGTNADAAGLWRFSIRNGAVTMGGGGTQTCGMGLCRVVVPRCSMDNEPLPCTPHSPEPEQCDGMDHDCNGVANDGVISCGIGACRRTVPLCTGNRMTECVPGEPTPEGCDGIDSNCNGTVDDCCTRAGDDAGCMPWPRLAGRAGPYGNCQCHAYGVRGAERGGAWLVLMAMVAAIARRTRRARARRGHA